MPERRGWVSQPDERGTIDIIWTCISALLICLWAMLHLNIPAKDDGFWTISSRKARYMLIGALLPEMPASVAVGQWAAATRSVKNMKAAGHENWTMVHAFYVEIGGFLLETREQPPFPPFPISPKQFQYLLHKGYVERPEISEQEIWDKSKADKAIKVIAFVQILWLITQNLARAIQHLPVSTLELSTMGTVTASIISIAAWFRKPLDVSEPTLLKAKLSISEILIQAQSDAREPYRNVSLDFIERQEYIGTLYSSILHLDLGTKIRPLPRLPNDPNMWFHNHAAMLMAAAPFAILSSILMIGWNFSFPSTTERIIWRCASLVYISTLAIWGAVELFGQILNGFTKTWLHNMKSYKQKWPQSLFYHVPITLSIIARFVIAGLCIAELRSLPAGCYKNIEWVSFIPHI